MLQRKRRNTISRRSTRVRITCRAFPLWLDRQSSSLLSFVRFTYQFSSVICLFALLAVKIRVYIFHYVYVCMYVGFKMFYVVRHLDSTTSYLPTGLHLGLFRSWPSLYLPSSFSSVFLVLSFVSASTSMVFWVISLLPFFEHGRTM